MTNTLSAQGLALIQEHEGFQPEPLHVAEGVWFVGYSHVRMGGPGLAVNQNEAAEILSRDLAPFEHLVNARVSQPLTQSQFEALVSFAFSIGATAFEQSQVLRRVNAGDMCAAACAMDAWRKADVAGDLVVVDALVRRRAAEKALFLKDLPARSAPSALVRAKLDYAAQVLGAPAVYTTAPEVCAATQPKPDLGQRITEILMSEPATEALLLTQVVPEGVDENEIVTAHAKPVARTIESKLPELPVDRRIRAQREQQAPRFQLPEGEFGLSLETASLIALLAVGVGLIVTGASLLMSGVFDLVTLAAAALMMAPGLCATAMGGFGLWRPHPKPVEN